MLYIYTAKLKEGKEKQYKAWSLKNTAKLKRRHGQGWKLVGAYGTVGLSDFDVAWIWQFKRWSDWDAFYDLEDKVLDKLMQEESKFFLPGTGRAVVIREMDDWLMPMTRKKKWLGRLGKASMLKCPSMPIRYELSSSEFPRSHGFVGAFGHASIRGFPALWSLRPFVRDVPQSIGRTRGALFSRG